MTDAGYAAAFEALPRDQRSKVKAAARRGATASTKADAALIVWWARRQLVRGPWPALGLAAVVVAVVVTALIATGQLTPVQIFGNPILAIIVLVPFAAWPSQRRTLQKSVRANIGVLTGKIPASMPSVTEIDELLDRPKVLKLIRGRPPDGG